MNVKSKFQRNLFRKLSLLAFFCSLSAALMAQTKTISGVVKASDNGEQLIGVTVVVKGTTTGTVTNIDGKYTIKTDAGSILVYSMVGMKSVEAKVGENSVINVVLSTDVKTLEQVVVTGYSSQKKADLTGAVTVVDIDDLKKATANNPIQALQGRAPGVNITTDGSPSGSGISVRIRGIGTLNNNDPMYVVDGVPTKQGMHELNPNDIESIQVLKDASAASIYGSRAANGVIIITTKKAKEGQLKVNASARTSFSWYGNKMDMLDTEGYGRAMWQAYVNSGKDPNSNNVLYQYDWAKNASGVAVLNKITLPDYLDATQKMRTANTDWYKEITQNAVSQSYDVSVLRGSDKGNTMFSLNYTNNDGIIKTTNFERYSARINSDTKLLNNKLVIGENLSLNKTKETTDPGVMDLTFQTLPLIPVHTVDGIGWGGPVSGMNDRQNPVRLLEDNKTEPLRLFTIVW